MPKIITVNTTPAGSISVTEQSSVDSLEVTQNPVNDDMVTGTRAELIEAKTTGPQGIPGEPGTGGITSGYVIREISDELPDTTDWEVNDLWLDTSTE